METSSTRIHHIKDFVIEVGKIVIVSLAIIIPIRHFLIQPFYVKGASMEPNFEDHEYLIVDEITYRLREPARGEIVVFRPPTSTNQYYIKRIVGMPGEEVSVKGERVYINGKLLDEGGYLPSGLATYGEGVVALKSNEYFVMGDNRTASLDSRSFGPIMRDDILGRTVFRGWPYNRIEWFEAPRY